MPEPEVLQTIKIRNSSYQKLVFAAALYHKSIPAVIDDLVERAIGDSLPDEPVVRDLPGSRSPEIPIFKIYKGRRFEGRFDLRTQVVTLLTEPFHGKVFRTPTEAAVAVVRHVNPDRRHPETNGYRFWLQLSNGQDLDGVRGEAA